MKINTTIPKEYPSKLDINDIENLVSDILVLRKEIEE